MNNSIKVTIPFSFKGKEYAPFSIIDLDELIESKQDFNAVLHRVANENKIDNYSYEYEILESSSCIFSDPTGLATDFLSEGEFDLEGFKAKKKESQVSSVINNIAKETFGTDGLDDETFKQALMQAYNAGRDSVLKGNK